MAYLDHAATTPMLAEALDAYVAAAREVGNPSSLHAAGRRARRLGGECPGRSPAARRRAAGGRPRGLVEESRERIAAALGARPSEVVFTSGGTESDNLATKGVFWAQRAASLNRNRVVASAVEHHGGLHAVDHHAVVEGVDGRGGHEAAAITRLPVDETGRVDPASLADLLERYRDE